MTIPNPEFIFIPGRWIIKTEKSTHSYEMLYPTRAKELPCWDEKIIWAKQI